MTGTVIYTSLIAAGGVVTATVAVQTRGAARDRIQLAGS